jgi:UDP-glucose 4-epimerase
VSRDELSGAVVLITGGTGSFGSTMVKELLKSDVSEVRILSRDETKQDFMRNSIKDSRLNFFLGDVRDKGTLQSAIRESDYIFHAAALKQVPSGEFFPLETVKTNVLGSENVLSLAIEYGVKTVVCLSTDKAVYPINAMGMSKAMMEKVAFAKAREASASETKIAVTRYGNVMMSRGSVIPLFVNQIRGNEAITVTNKHMTRFLMSLSDSVDLVKHAFANADSGDLFVQKAPACTVETLIAALEIIENKQGQVEIKEIGIRHGEKMHESLLGAEERMRSLSEDNFFRVPLDTRKLDYQIYFQEGQKTQTQEPFTSENAKQLSVDEVVKLVSCQPEYQNL